MAAVSGHALLGSYQPATLIAVEAGLYEVRFDDGGTKWATSCELLSTEAPTSPPEDGASVAMLTIDGSENYTQATFVAANASTWTVRSYQGQEHQVASGLIRLPLSAGAGPRGKTAPPLRDGDSVCALRGEWVQCTLVSAPQPSTRCSAQSLIRLTPPGGSNLPVEIRVPAGTLILDSAGSSAADSSQQQQQHQQQQQQQQREQLLVPGHFAIELSADGGAPPLEVEVLSAADETSGQVLVRAAGSPEGAPRASDSPESADAALDERWVPMACLRPRHALSYRVLVSTGGFQRGTLEAVNPDGSMCVALVGGGRRWCSAAEVAFVPIGGGSALGNTGLGRSSAPAGSHPESGVLLGVLPSGSAAAGAHALFSAARAALAPANAGGDDGGRPVWLPSAVTLEGGQARLQTGQRKEWRVGQPAAADGDGDDEEVRAEEGEEGWRPAADRLVAPLLSRLRGAQPRALPLGSEVYALTGAWEEAFVESQEDEFYLVRERSGALRWVIAGETAWYDVSPEPFDLSVGKALIAWDARCAQFQAAVLVHEESSRGASSGGGKWIVRYDDGDEASVDVSLMRDRWQLHLRVLCLWGDYYPARVVEALGGLIRVDHGGGHVRWSLPEQTLQKEPPEIHDLIPGAFVAVRLGARTGGREPLGAPGATSPRAAASSDAASNVFRRALLESCDPSGEAELLLDDGSRVSAPIRNVRLPQPENARVPEGTEVYSLFGEWYAGVVPSESLADETINGRFQLSLFHDRGRWTTYASRREMVQADGGSSEPGSALWRLRKGAPLCVRPPAHSGGGGGAQTLAVVARGAAVGWRPCWWANRWVRVACWRLC